MGGWNSNFYYNGGTTKPTILCTSSPDYGGFDRSPASFRRVTVSPRGDVSTEALETFVKGQVTLASPIDTAYAESGRIRLYAAAFASGSPVVRVRVGVEEKGRSIVWQNLNKTSSWAWSGFYITSPTSIGSSITLTIQAATANGNVFESKKTAVVKEQMSVSGISTTPWTNLLGNPEHVGIVPSGFNGKLQHLWSVNSQGNTLFASPIVGHNRVFVAAFDELQRNKSSIAAFDVNTGKADWYFFPQEPIVNSFCLFDSKVIATDIAGNIYGIDATTGKVAWKNSLDVPLLPGVTSGSVLADSIYYTGSGNSLMAVNANTGSTIWKSKGLFNPDGSTVTKTIGDGVLLLSSNLRGLYAFNATTGKEMWKHLDEKLFLRDGNASYYNNRFHIVSNGQYYAIVPQTGEIDEQLFLPYAVDANTTPLFLHDILYFGTSNSGLVAYNIRTNEVKWVIDTGVSLINTNPNADTPDKSVETSPIMVGSYVIFGASDGYLYVADAANGKVVQQVNLGAPILSTPAVSGNLLIVNDYSGNTSAFKLME